MRTLRRRGLELVVLGLVLSLAAVTWDLSTIAATPMDPGQPDHEEILHNTAATLVVALGVALSTIGLRFVHLDGRASRRAYAIFAASSLLFADGILHFYAVGEHLAIWPFALFFVASGALLLALGFGMFRAQPWMYRISILATVGLIVLFFVSRTVALPFGGSEPEPYEALGILSKAVEIVAIGVLIALLLRWKTDAREPTESAPEA